MRGGKERWKITQFSSIIKLINSISPIAVVRHSWRCNFPKNTKFLILCPSRNCCQCFLRSLAAGRLSSASCGARLPPDADNCPLCPVVPPPPSCCTHSYFTAATCRSYGSFQHFPKPQTVFTSRISRRRSVCNKTFRKVASHICMCLNFVGLFWKGLFCLLNLFYLPSSFSIYEFYFESDLDVLNNFLAQISVDFCIWNSIDPDTDWSPRVLLIPADVNHGSNIDTDGAASGLEVRGACF